MKIAFLNNGLQSQLATQHLIEKHNFKEFSITQIVKQIAKKYFNIDNDDNFIKSLKSALEAIDKYILIRYIFAEMKDVPNCVIPDICNIVEYYSVLMEGFIPVKIDSKDIHYNESLIDIPMLKIGNETDLKLFYDNLDSLISNYTVLEQNKTKGGTIKYIDDDSQED